MFEGDWSELGPRATLAAAADCAETENDAALGKLHAAQHFADLYADLPEASHLAWTVRGGERLKVYGGDGCPAMAEFAPAEFAAVLGLSTPSGTALIGEALALRHRFPRLWASTRAGQTLVWRARAVARGCLKLSLEAALWVDERITGKINGLSTTKFYDLLDALITQADPAAARRAAEDHAKNRGVFVNPSDGEGTKTIYVKAATGDVIRFDATITDLAWALAMLGDTDTPDQRRAKALGWIADPTAAYELLHAARYLTTHQPTTPTGTDANSSAGSTAAPGTTDTAQVADLAQAADATQVADVDDQTDPDSGNANMDTDTDTDAGAVGDDRVSGPASSIAERSAGDELNPNEPTRSAALTSPPAADSPAAPSNGDPGDGDPGAGVQGEEWVPGKEPAPDDEADRDTPHPSIGGHLDHLDTLTTRDILKMIERDAWRHPRPPRDSDTLPRQGTSLPTNPASTIRAGTGKATSLSGEGAESGGSGDQEDAFSWRALAGKLAAIKKTAHTTSSALTSASTGTGIGRRGRPQTVLYVHLTDQTLHSTDGILRVEEHGILLAHQLRELLGHDQVVLKPVIDLNHQIHTNAYEIPIRIREHVKLTHPVEQFPYGTTETTMNTDLDHITPYDPNGPPGQTSTLNLSPLGRFHHRLKTYGRWHPTPHPDGGQRWTTPNGYQFHADHTGTHRITPDDNGTDDGSQAGDDQTGHRG